MSQTEQKIDRLSGILEGFITRQEGFNNKIEGKVDNLEGKVDNLEGKVDNLEGKVDNLEIKADKTQYFLEEAIANDAKMFFEEQTRQSTRLRMLDDEVANLKSNMQDMSLQISALEKV